MTKIAYYDPLLFKYPKGTVSKGTEVTFNIEISKENAPNEVYLMLKNDDDADYSYLEMSKNDGYFSKSVKFENSGHFWYKFKLNFNGYSLYVNKTYNNYSSVNDYQAEDFFQQETEEEYGEDVNVKAEKAHDRNTVPGHALLCYRFRNSLTSSAV